MRLIRACHDLGIEAVAVYSTADRDGLWVEQADRAVCIGPPPGGRQLPEHPQPDRRRRDHRLRRGAPGLGLPGRERRLRPRLHRQRPGVRRPARRGDGADGRQEPWPSRRCARPAAAGARLATAGWRAPPRQPALAGRVGYPVLLKAVGRRRRARHAAGRLGRPSSTTPSGWPRPRPRPPSATAACTWRRRSSAPATSRCRCWPTATAACWCWASATARSSAATRS